MLPGFYHEQQRKRKQKRMIKGAIVFFTLCVAGFFLVSTLSPKTTGVLKPANHSVLSENASLELTTLYECGHSKTRLLSLPEDLVGKSMEETVQLHPEWSVLNFNESLVVAEQKEGTECDDHFLLFLKDGKIVVTKSKDKTQLITEQSINLNLLTKEDKEILEAGIFIDSEYELLEILESFR
ncbi:MAG: hypothetical protein J6A61_01955 [Clostridia bacterium]|nr:hypothetical protein [Clostridia bacterium]MBO5408153.1 hypothetical protein [Clostridia bacterium]